MDFVEERIPKTARERGLDPMEVWRRAASGKQGLLSVAGAGGAAALAGREEER
jgi:hypothetical protein